MYYNKFNDINYPNVWGSSNSSVQYAITTYARMYLNQFKNMKNKSYIGGDTDSIILTKPSLDQKN